jgi:hypothetical protein
MLELLGTEMVASISEDPAAPPTLRPILASGTFKNQPEASVMIMMSGHSLLAKQVHGQAQLRQTTHGLLSILTVSGTSLLAVVEYLLTSKPLQHLKYGSARTQ